MMSRVCLLGVVTGFLMLGGMRAGLGQEAGAISTEAMAAGSAGGAMRESGARQRRLDPDLEAARASEVAVREVAPLCPGQIARLVHAGGVVVLRALVGKDGTVESLSVVSGPGELRGSATKAVAQWKYRPYLVDGQAIEVYKTIEVEYAMSR